MAAGSYSAVAKARPSAWAAIRDWPDRRPIARAAGLTACTTRLCAGPASSASGASVSARWRSTPSMASCGNRMQVQSIAASMPAFGSQWSGDGPFRCNPAAAPENAQLTGIHNHAQGRRWSIGRSILRAVGKRQCSTGFGSDLQTAQGAVVHLPGPAHHGTAAPRAQALFGGPQSVTASGLDDAQLVQIHSGAKPGMGVGQVRWAYQHDSLTCTAQPSQRRPQQAKLTDAWGSNE